MSAQERWPGAVTSLNNVGVWWTSPGALDIHLFNSLGSVLGIDKLRGVMDLWVVVCKSKSQEWVLCSLLAGPFRIEILNWKSMGEG